MIFISNVILRGELGVNSQDVEHTKTEMKNNVIDFIEELIKSLREEKKGSSWPQLQAINVNASSLSFKDLWPENNQETFVIVERADSYIGKEVRQNFVRVLFISLVSR